MSADQLAPTRRELLRLGIATGVVAAYMPTPGLSLRAAVDVGELPKSLRNLGR